MKKKTIALVLAIVLVLAIAVGGTVAWLLDETDPVVNTFTTSDVDITLQESNNLDLQMIPGHTITKDPTVTVLADSEKCYVFVKVEESTNFNNFMTYAIADDWTQGTGADGNGVPTDVWYREVEDTTADQSFAVIKENTVAVKGDVTKAMMDGLTEDTYPTLTFTAYACQYYSTNNTAFDVGVAWTNASASANN